MQQPMNQQDPIGGQQAMSQQMVLCPVRFVYETQVLVQPGDQIQPNQTFFINPQNPPPWMQNRPAQNPVVYVQQLPNNVVPSVQQHMDQNQLYLQQNLTNYQLQQHMLAQSPQEMRPTMQIANIMPNMVQNIQQTITNDRNVGNVTQNTNTQMTQQMQANAQNIMQNQINAANVRQVSQPINQQMSQPINQTVEVQRQVFMNMRPQMNQQVQINNITRPVMSLNQFQNMQALANLQNVQIQQGNVGQTFVHTIGPRSVAQNVNTVRPQTVVGNVMNVQPVPKIREIVPQEVNKTVTNVGTGVANVGTATVPTVRNFAQNYNRPIQPRRRYVQQTATGPKVQTQHIPVQTISTIYNPQTVQIADKSQQMPSTSNNTTYLNNPNINRKRKSESPDEMKNKTMAVMNNTLVRPNYIIPQQNVMVAKVCNEVGTNTSPVHKPRINTNNTAYLNPTTPSMVVEQTPIIKTEAQTNTDQKPAVAPLVSENDKLVRNTVFTQARGRVLQDKVAEIVVPPVIEATPQIVAPIVQNVTATVSTEVQTIKGGIPEEKTEKSSTTNEERAESSKIEEIKTTVEPKKMEIDEKKPEVIEKSEVVVTKMEVDQEINVKAETQVKEENAVKSENVAKEDVKSEEELKEVKEEDEKKVTKLDILTHVVDGYVIQESSFAFPIRKPLKEKTLFTNPKAEDSEMSDALKECMKEEMKTNVGDIPLLPFHYLLLNEKKEEQEEKKEEVAEDSEKCNPFAKLQHATVKSWTVDDISSHLHKYGWKDTVSVLQDHEIDGESLFLVSKTQLITIGVSEEHAEIICDFVRS